MRELSSFSADPLSCLSELFIIHFPRLSDCLFFFSEAQNKLKLKNSGDIQHHENSMS